MMSSTGIEKSSAMRAGGEGNKLSEDFVALTQNNMIPNGPWLHRGIHRIDAAQVLWRTF